MRIGRYTRGIMAGERTPGAGASRCPGRPSCFLSRCTLLGLDSFRISRHAEHNVGLALLLGRPLLRVEVELIEVQKRPENLGLGVLISDGAVFFYCFDAGRQLRAEILRSACAADNADQVGGEVPKGKLEAVFRPGPFRRDEGQSLSPWRCPLGGVRQWTRLHCWFGKRKPLCYANGSKQNCP